MSAVFIPRGGRVAANGSALVIVLFFVILLSVVTIAFLARSITAVKVSASSAGETKSKILASSASDIIIGDLKQEIVAGSAGSGTASFPVYVPSYNTNMIPFQNGVPTSGTLIPNLISRSVNPNNTAGSAPYKAYPSSYTSTLVPLNRAANDSSATPAVSSSLPSINGRYISPAQWNAHYLIPRSTSITPGSTSTDSTPVSSFVVPDWVVVTRAGANSVPWSSGSGGLNDPTITNTNCAVGRYAYAVYNEGGTLDMNAAGYPSDSSNPGGAGSNGLTATQISQKGSLALADLTQLTAGTVNLTQTQINNFVGWRNYASAKMSAANGSFGSFTFTPATASNWLTNFVTGNTNAFMQIAPPPPGQTTPPTDQALLSRQQLISVTKSLGISPDFLQYMGTFSRALEQPSFVPETGRPGVIGTSAPPPAYASVTSNADYYQGNSGDYDQNYLGTTSFVIPTANPSFLAIRVKNNFTRYNGVAAVIGEPLVKTKFALSRLGMFSPTATTTTIKASSYFSTSDTDPALDRFGLSRSSTTAPWTYNHGQNYIMTLAEVAQLSPAREPDFAELLKAAINVGTLGKGGPNLNANTGTNNYQYTVDTSTDYAILQIMANLIDQADTDSFPTAIQIGVPGVGTVSYYRTFYGIEDLPYFYRYHPLSVVDVQPAPLLQRSNAVTFAPGSFGYPSTYGGPPPTTPDTNAYTFNWMSLTSSTLGPLTKAGDVALMYIPEIWNPHDPSTQSTTASRPQKFRIIVTTADPVAQTTAWKIGAQCNLANFNATDGSPSYVSTQGIVPVASYPTASTPIAFDPPTAATPNTALTFSDVNGTLFREPTLLWRQNFPAGVSLTNVGSATAKLTDLVTNQTYVGVVAGKCPISTTVTVGPSSPAKATDGTYVVQGNGISYTTTTPTGSFPQLTFTLQYQDASSNWITYDVKYPDLHGMASPALDVNPADYTGLGWNGLQNPIGAQLGDTATGIDPRTARFGVGTSDALAYAGTGATSSSPGLEPAMISSYQQVTTAATTALAASNFTVVETQRPRQDQGDFSNYSGPGETINAGRNVQMRWFSGPSFSATDGQTTDMHFFDGMLEQNNWQAKILARDGTTLAGIFSEDPDGVARRAKGAYAPTAIGTAPSTTTPIGLPMATANTYAANNGVGAATSQAQSRDIILNRPLRSVSEMSYAFKGSPWKNIDFFTPESGDTALLDTFCINEPPPTATIAGRVDLNTRNAPVLQAVVAGAYRDELNNVTTPPSWALPNITGAEAANLANKLVAITSDTADGWRGPLPNIGALVGRYVQNPGTTSAGTVGTDWYTYTQTSAPSGAASANSYTYAGLSGLLDSTYVYTSTAGTSATAASAPYIQRFREAGLRPLIDAGQVRVWNLLIDVVAQTGHYPKTATGFDQFVVDGQTRLWVHVAIDRYTGQVIDKQVELYTP